MRRFFALLFGLALGTGILLVASQVPVLANTDPMGLGSDEGMKKPLLRTETARSGFSTAAVDTVYYGFKLTSADPNKVGAGVGSAGGKWDFDTGISGTDSTQYWKFYSSNQTSNSDIYPTPASRPWWYFEYGNSINRGNHNLWKARALAGRAFRRTGLAGVWHADNMSTVSGSPGNINGSRSAWCGLRPTSDAGAPIDELTGNPFTNAENQIDHRGGGAVRSSYPGYSNLWNQLLYRDFTYSGAPIPMSFRVRTDFGYNRAADPGGDGWFTPDPTSSSNFVLNAADSLCVWVGKPKDTLVYDTNRRYLSEVVDFGTNPQPQKLYAVGGKLPVVRTAVFDTTVTLAIPTATWGGTVRVVFQVHTNRFESDQSTSATGFNSLDGAVVLDDVNVGGDISTFDAAQSIRPRVLLSQSGTETPISPSTTWITTGRPPRSYGHIHNANDLPYDDPCGTLDGLTGARNCNLAGNVLLMSNHDDPSHNFQFESQEWALTPTIVINAASPRGILQGTPANLKTEAGNINLQMDYYSGFDANALTGVVFWWGVRYMGAGLTSLNQIAEPKVANWSPINTPGFISSYGTPTCATMDTDADLDGSMPIAFTDSCQFGLENQVRCGRYGSTACGETRGTYWDNVRAGFIRGAAAVPSVATGAWMLYGDTFPFNEDISPGSVEFDTTTALVMSSLNNGNPAGTEGVARSDTLVYDSPYSGNDARMDLVFRIWPGPGNYAGRNVGPGGSQDPWALRHNRILKVPAVGDEAGNYASANDGSFWGQYMGNNGPVGSASGHTSTYWDPQTWNSARMDSAQLNYSPVVSVPRGLPLVDTWMGTYHELDPNYNILGITRDLCFLIAPTGVANHTNTCCSEAQCAGSPFFTSWPPPGYDPAPGSTSTKEGTKILPDGIFTPGTHVQYFVRRSKQSNPSVLENMSPDTTVVAFQPGMMGSTDCLRYDHLDVLPDMWKDLRYSGSGLACILYVDAADRRGYEDEVIGALDSLGYGRDDGASRGWKRTPDNWTDRNDPVGFVPENLGQSGVAYDKFDQRASESGEANRIGCRIVGGGVLPELQGVQCKQGPTPAMLDEYYDTIIYDAGDLDNGAGALHDCSGIAQEQSCDAGILSQWLDLAADGNEKALFILGDGAAQDLAISGTASMDLLRSTMGFVHVRDNYFQYSGNLQPGAVYKPLATTGDKFNSARRYGFFNSCVNLLDVIDKDGGVVGAELAARYEQFSDRSASGVGPGPYGAAVYRRLDADAGRYYATLINGMPMNRFRSWNGKDDPTTQNISLSFNNHAGQAWMEDALLAFNLCSRPGAVISVGDQPGMSALNFVRGAFPNPSVAGAATVQFSLASPAKVTLRFYNVAGRLVHETSVDGVAGLNSYRWTGVTSTGMKAASGVYFYRLSAPGVDFQNNSQRMVLLGQAN
jgi:hypothetical protein